MNAHVIFVRNILRMLVTSAKIDFSVTTCRFIKYIFLISRTALAIVKVIRLYVCIYESIFLNIPRKVRMIAFPGILLMNPQKIYDLIFFETP